jgi:hypothetical protein
MRRGPHLVIYDHSNTERLTSIDFGPMIFGENGIEKEVWVWNKKNFDDAPEAQDVRVSVVGGNTSGGQAVEMGYLKVRSSGIIDPDGAEIVDDSEPVFSEVGDDLVSAYHSIGNIPTNCARRLYFRVDLPEGASIKGIPIVIVRFGFRSDEIKWLYAPE